jgi:hypothetical protein
MLPLLSPFFLAALIVSLLWEAHLAPIQAAILAAISTSAMCAGALALLFLARRNGVTPASPEADAKRPSPLGFSRYVVYFFLSEVAVVAGWLDFARGRVTGSWEPTISNRGKDSLDRLKGEWD